MSNIDKQALREAAEKATPGKWWIDSHGQAMVSFIDNDVLEVFATDNKRAAVRHEDTGNLSRWRNDNDATFIATADPATVLALLDELEAAEKRIAELEAREVLLPPKAPDNLASCLGGYEKWLIATTFRDTWNACLAEVVRVNAAAGKGE
ncbi:TPA: ead/Ea22-like family protein [Enterobacter hormaechei]|nr:ead/Ea22-like family protein [Enterobacter hormaechei]HBL6103438.1 ead/Ea22-like family protein [Enterobacter hormaechei]HBL9171180.1 ead/Ea22-like family protein [Enterobacter hormaechei]